MFPIYGSFANVEVHIKNLICAMAAAVTLAGCSGGSSVPTSNAPRAAAKRAYNGTASVGDFLSISIDSNARTIAYTDHSNGETGTVPYTINSDGSYAITDPSGNLVSAYEVPGYALVVAAQKVGPDRATPALVTAVESGPISLATFSSHNYNFMEFRTAAGGFEAGSVAVDANDNISGASYWPLGSFISNASPINDLRLSLSGAIEDPSGTFMKLALEGQTNYMFGTANGQFLIDTPNGAILGLQQSASPAFDPASAGTYNAIYFEKTNVETRPGNIETGAGTIKKASIAIDASAHITVTDATGTVIVNSTLMPVADTAYLQGPGLLSGPCPGLFTFRVIDGSSQRDVFVAFQGRALMFASFTGLHDSELYSYDYGVGLH
jgi:hypothetical protein